MPMLTESLSFQSPLWLTALACIPLLWWLQRYQRSGYQIKVPSLLLWQKSINATLTNQPGRQTDPVWWLRTLIFCLVVLSLSQPQWFSSESDSLQPLVIWLDDSISMYAQENDHQQQQRSRIQLGIVKAGELVGQAFTDAMKPTSIIVRPLSHPGKSLPLDITDAVHWKEQVMAWLPRPPSEPIDPAAIGNTGDAKNWFVSDGASENVTGWVNALHPDQLIPVGDASENVGVSRMSLRADLVTDDALLLTVHLRNQGDESAGRELIVTLNGEPIEQRHIQLTSGSSSYQSFSLPSSQKDIEVVARITPSDALAEDDQMRFFWSMAKHRIYYDSGCGAGFKAALALHPAIELTSSYLTDAGTQADLQVLCSDKAAPEVGPAIVLLGSPGGWRQPKAVSWIPPARTVPAGDHSLTQTNISPPWLEVNRLSQTKYDLSLSQQPLLVSDFGPLIGLDAAHNLLYVGLNMEDPRLLRRPEFPVLVDYLIRQVLPTVGVSYSGAGRNQIQFTGIKPRPLTTQEPISKVNQSGQGKKFSLLPWLVLFTLMLLAVECLIISNIATTVKPHSRVMSGGHQ